jgi:hypothetical protein
MSQHEEMMLAARCQFLIVGGHFGPAPLDARNVCGVGASQIAFGEFPIALKNVIVCYKSTMAVRKVVACLAR